MSEDILYLSGPMSNHKDNGWNFDAFHSVARTLRERGWTVINPAENIGGDTDLQREWYMRHDIKQLMDATGIVLLPGWEKSDGAKVETLVADSIGLDLYMWDEKQLEAVTINYPEPDVNVVGLRRI